MATTSSGFNFLCLFPIFSILISHVFFVQPSVSTTGNCSTRASYIYCLDSGLPSTWYNNNSVIMNDWQMRVFLLFQNDDDIDFYCGFFCNGTCDSYLFSVVAVADGGSHSLVWSANRDRPVKRNAMVELTRSGLLLRDSDGTQVWSSNMSLSGNSVVGMNLNQSGNLVLFNNESQVLWQSPAEKISLHTSPNTSAITPSSPLPVGNTPPSISPTPSPPFPPSNLALGENQPESPVPPGTGKGRKNVVRIVAEIVRGVVPSSTPYLTLPTPAPVIRGVVIAPHPPVENIAPSSTPYLTLPNSNSAPAPVLLGSPKPSAITPSPPLPVGNTPPSISPTPRRPFPTSNLAPGANQPEPPVPPGTGKGRKNVVGIVAGSVGGGVFIIGILIVLFIAKIRRSEVEEQDEDYIKIVPGMLVRFSYEELRVATNDFEERLGGGGFGTVYKGVLQNGMMIAVKRLDRMGQGMREFLAEVETIGSLHHFNLVRLIGFCVEKSCRLLVYEYMCNGSLDKWIFIRNERPCLDWQTRKKILLDIAKGLAYLHEDCRHRIIHLDIKPQNILLDENFSAKVSDFGLSQLIGRDESQVQTTMRGTPGYIAPEWRKSKITVKVDIYSFGIVLLEVVSSRRNFDSSRSESSYHLLKLLQTKAEENRLIDIVENLEANMQQNVREEMIRMIKIGAWCLQDDPTKRPSMSTVVKVLEGVMEVDENIIYRFSHATLSAPVVHEPPSAPPPPSVLSNPR